MSIAVICPGCKAQFRVSDKFAGKKGPCPKCKAEISIPKPEEVKIHTPEEFSSGGKDAKGRLITKPIARTETKIRAVPLVGIIGGTIAVLVLAFLIGRTVDPSLLPPVCAIGLAVVSPPLCIAAYSFLRNDDLEPYQGTALYIRTGICSLVYAGMWGVFYFVPNDWFAEPWNWLFIAPPFLAVGAIIALSCLDLDVINGFFHYCFYLLVTILLRALVGLPALWAMGTA